MRHLITLLLFLGAIAAYTSGSTWGAAAFVVGLVLENLVLYRLVRDSKQLPDSTD
jgi:hypothetical protein